MIVNVGAPRRQPDGRPKILFGFGKILLLPGCKSLLDENFGVRDLRFCRWIRLSERRSSTQQDQ
jgi:hypothetical protein